MMINPIGIIVFMPFIGAFLSYIIGRFNKTARNVFADVLVIAELSLLAYLFANFSSENLITLDVDKVCGFGLHFVLSGFRGVYTLVAALMWCMTTIFSAEYFKHYHNRNRYYMFMLLTLGATMGVFLSADLYTTFIFFEIMSFTSYVWVAHDEKKPSMRAAETYLAVAVIGGMVMLMGLFLLYNAVGTLEISKLFNVISRVEDKRMIYAAAACITVGFGAKAGAFPLHIWLPKAHPVAPAPASALLSGILTKSGVYGILVVSCNMLYGNDGWAALILILAVITMFTGALLALFSTDLKRTLACSSMSQIGFIMVGIGMHGLLGAMVEAHTGGRPEATSLMNLNAPLPSAGILLHMMNHSIIKLVLFMAAGVVFMNLHKLDLNEIKGFGRKKPFLNIVFLIGALGIGGIPLFNGYISKTLLHESIVEYYEELENFLNPAISSFKFYSPSVFAPETIKLIEWIFLISGGMTVAYMTKLYLCLFVFKNNNDEVQKKYDDMKSYMNIPSKIAIGLSALIIPIMGFFPGVVMDFFASRGVDLMNAKFEPGEVHYFSLENLKGACISIGIGALIYFGFIIPLLTKKDENGKRVYVNRWPAWLDLENLIYRPLIAAVCYVAGFLCRILDCALDTVVVFLRKTIYKDCPLKFEHEGDSFTFWLGTRLNNAQKTADDIFDGTYDDNIDFVHEFSLRKTKIKELFFIMTRTLSFGMLLCCIGMLVGMIYLLMVHW